MLTKIFKRTPALLMQVLAHMHIKISGWFMDKKLGHACSLTNLESIW